MTASSAKARLSRALAPAPADEHASLRIWLRLLTCTNLVTRDVRRRLREEFDTTLPRFDVLAQLDAASRRDVRGMTMSELSRRLMVTNGNLTGLIERLVLEGLVTRAADPHDRRNQIVRLTANGARAMQAMIPSHECWINEMFDALTREERTQLHHLLGRVRGSIRQTEDPQE